MVPYPLAFLEVNDDIALISFIIIQSIWTFILFPLTVYYIIQLWKLHKQNVLFISKRRPQIVTFSILLFSLYPVLIRPLIDLPRLWNEATRFDNEYVRMNISSVIYLFVYGILARIWLLYYDYERNIASFSMQWSTRLKYKETDYIPWTLRYKKIGNTKIVFVISIVLWLITVAMINLGAYMFGIYFRSQFQVVAMIPPIFAAIIIAFKIRKWNDTLYLKKELQLMVFVTLLAYMLYMCTVYPFLDYFWNIRILVSNVIICGYCYILALVSSKWVIVKYKKQCNAHETPGNKQLDLEEVLTNDIGFKLFADYLVQEYSIEHLCFLYEIMKLKHQLIASEMITKKEAGILISMNYKDKLKKISPNNVRDMYEIKSTLKHIVDRYICIDSEQSVNISARIRSNILKLPLKQSLHPLQCTPTDISTDDFPISMVLSSRDKIETMTRNSSTTMSLHDSMNIEMYLKRFDGAIEEIVKLLTHDSLGRFYESEQYQQMIRNK